MSIHTTQQTSQVEVTSFEHPPKLLCRYYTQYLEVEVFKVKSCLPSQT